MGDVVEIPEKPVEPKKPLNPQGNNRFTNRLPDMPYSIRFARAKAMLDLGKTWEEIHLATALSTETINRIKKGEREVNDVLVEAIKRDEGKKLTLIQHEILDAITSSDIEKASLLQKVTSAAVLIDKRQLLEGKATQRVGFEGVQDEGLNAQILALEGKLEAWQDGKIVNTSTVSTESESVDIKQD